MNIFDKFFKHPFYKRSLQIVQHNIHCVARVNVNEEAKS